MDSGQDPREGFFYSIVHWFLAVTHYNKLHTISMASWELAWHCMGLHEYKK